jgi:hypothetical protein
MRFHKRKALILILFFLFSLSAFAQKRYFKRWEIGLALGASNYLGEMGGNLMDRRDLLADMQFRKTGPAIGGFIGYHLDPYITLRMNLQYGQLAGDDKLSSNFGRHLRNTNFKTYIFECSTIAEYKLISYRDIVHRYIAFRNLKSFNVSLYGFLGMGVFAFDPRSKYNGTYYRLQPLGTEGQGIYQGKEKYSLIQAAVPMGMGLFFSSRFPYKFGLEIGYRKTFTDYLDDVSDMYADPVSVAQRNGTIAGALVNRAGEINTNKGDLLNTAPGQKRGDPTHKDAYIFTVLKFSYAFHENRRIKYRSKF